MADFGKAGKLTIRIDDVAAVINLTAGEYLHYKLTVKGAVPIFTFSCKHEPLLSEHEFAGHPKQVYEWTWCKPTAGDPGVPDTKSDAADDMLGIPMSFITAIKYTVLVEHKDRSNASIRTLKDFDCESQDPHDNFTSSLRIFTT
jgi:hypothetical protein